MNLALYFLSKATKWLQWASAVSEKLTLEHFVKYSVPFPAFQLREFFFFNPFQMWTTRERAALMLLQKINK